MYVVGANSTVSSRSCSISFSAAPTININTTAVVVLIIVEELSWQDTHCTQ